MTIRSHVLYLQGLTGYQADDDRRLLDTLFAGPGVVNGGLAVTQNSPVAANVLVTPGYVVVPAKTATKGKYLGQVTAAETVTITANVSGNPRIDIIVAQVLDTVDGADGSDAMQVVAIAGTPAGAPVAPATPANATLLANVAVANGFATITSGNITDKRANLQYGDTGWTVASLSNSWVSFDGGTVNDNPSYRRVNGVTHLKGCMKNGTTGTTVFTLPVGYRPLLKRSFAVPSNTGLAVVSVLGAGVFQLTSYQTGGSNASVFMDGICFPAEQ